MNRRKNLGTGTLKGIREFFDLKMETTDSHTSAPKWKETQYEYRQNHFLSAYGFHSSLRISEVRGQIQRQLQGKDIFMLGSISMYGFCTTYISGEPQRYTGMFTGGTYKALSHGHSRQCFKKYSGKCKSGTGLENLC